MAVTSLPTFFWAESDLRYRSMFIQVPLLRNWYSLGSDFAVSAGLVLGILLGLAATLGPLNVGLQAFRRLEH
jgi:hypothetical protein